MYASQPRASLRNSGVRAVCRNFSSFPFADLKGSDSLACPNRISILASIRSTSSFSREVRDRSARTAATASLRWAVTYATFEGSSAGISWYALLSFASGELPTAFTMPA